MLLAWDSRLGLDFFDSGLHTCTAVARLTLALAKLSCQYSDMIRMNYCENVCLSVFFSSCNEDSVDNLSDDGDIVTDLPSEDGE